MEHLNWQDSYEISVDSIYAGSTNAFKSLRTVQCTSSNESKTVATYRKWIWKKYVYISYTYHVINGYGRPYGCMLMSRVLQTSAIRRVGLPSRKTMKMVSYYEWHLNMQTAQTIYMIIYIKKVSFPLLKKYNFTLLWPSCRICADCITRQSCW